MSMGTIDPEGAKRDDIRGKVMTTKDLVAYQEGAVVSRTLIDKSVGTVTVFSFDQGQGLSEHTTPYDALVEILDGEVEITISGERHLVKAGEMIIMPANHPHALHATKAFKMMLIMIRA
jgi:quercetin dioxygenase-like cupin family protein